MRKLLALVGVMCGPATLSLSAMTVAKLAFLLAIFFIPPTSAALILLLLPILVISLTSFIAGGPSEGLLFFL